MASAHTDLNDAALVVRTNQGDAEAFDVLVRRHFRVVFLISMGVLANRMDAEDCSQETFLKALSVIEQCRNPERFAAWISQIARNTARNALAARAVRHTEPLDVAQPASESRADRATEQSELARRLETAFTVLTEVQRSIVLLHDLQGSTHGEIAAQLGISEVSSRQHLFLARRLLRQQLGESTLQEYLYDR